MLHRLIASRLVTRPAIWGKLPAHADYVRSGMRHGESESWQPWLSLHAHLPVTGAVNANTSPQQRAILPTSFVLPPAALSFAPRHFVIGVIAPSNDRAGRQHPLLVYQMAHPRWVRRYFEAYTHEPNDWLFWLARAVARHTDGSPGRSEMKALERTVQGLWPLYAPVTRDLWRQPPPLPPLDQHKSRPATSQAQALLQALAGPDAPDDPALPLQGVRYRPRVDWPQRLFRARADSAFWQQDASGGFVNAANRLGILWKSA